MRVIDATVAAVESRRLAARCAEIGALDREIRGAFHRIVETFRSLDTDETRPSADLEWLLMDAVRTFERALTVLDTLGPEFGIAAHTAPRVQDRSRLDNRLTDLNEDLATEISARESGERSMYRVVEHLDQWRTSPGNATRIDDASALFRAAAVADSLDTALAMESRITAIAGVVRVVREVSTLCQQAWDAVDTAMSTLQRVGLDVESSPDDLERARNAARARLTELLVDSPMADQIHLVRQNPTQYAAEVELVERIQVIDEMLLAQDSLRLCESSNKELAGVVREIAGEVAELRRKTGRIQGIEDRIQQLSTELEIGDVRPGTELFDRLRQRIRDPQIADLMLEMDDRERLFSRRRDHAVLLNEDFDFVLERASARWVLDPYVADLGRAARLEAEAITVLLADITGWSAETVLENLISIDDSVKEHWATLLAEDRLRLARQLRLAGLRNLLPDELADADLVVEVTGLVAQNLDNVQLVNAHGKFLLSHTFSKAAAEFVMLRIRQVTVNELARQLRETCADYSRAVETNDERSIAEYGAWLRRLEAHALRIRVLADQTTIATNSVPIPGLDPAWVDRATLAYELRKPEEVDEHGQPPGIEVLRRGGIGRWRLSHRLSTARDGLTEQLGVDPETLPEERARELLDEINAGRGMPTDERLMNEYCDLQKLSRISEALYRHDVEIERINSVLNNAMSDLLVVLTTRPLSVGTVPGVVAERATRLGPSLSELWSDALTAIRVFGRLWPPDTEGQQGMPPESPKWREFENSRARTRAVIADAYQVEVADVTSAWVTNRLLDSDPGPSADPQIRHALTLFQLTDSMLSSAALFHRARHWAEAVEALDAALADAGQWRDIIGYQGEDEDLIEALDQSIDRAAVALADARARRDETNAQSVDEEVAEWEAALVNATRWRAEIALRSEHDPPTEQTRGEWTMRFQKLDELALRLNDLASTRHALLARQENLHRRLTVSAAATEGAESLLREHLGEPAALRESLLRLRDSEWVVLAVALTRLPDAESTIDPVALTYRRVIEEKRRLERAPRSAPVDEALRHAEQVMRLVRMAGYAGRLDRLSDAVREIEQALEAGFEDVLAWRDRRLQGPESDQQ
ncbi:hypothetical protein [Nocardia brasiliensis]|uniref:hypothetical protein n=1 Tax=Nocardia brasiliensis TaxID=37326 RepID=UPI002454B4FA|nr:hypothetical protein [Nocardia brasiliensis]